MNWFALQYLNNAMIPVYEVKVDGVAIAKVWKNDPIYVKPEFTKQKVISAKLISNTKNKTLEIVIPNNEQVMKIEITEPIKNCSALKTGYVTSTINEKSWVREGEDIAEDQLNRSELKKLTTTFEYLFMARNAKTFIFNTDSSDNCLLKATSAKITILLP